MVATAARTKADPLESTHTHTHLTVDDESKPEIDPVCGIAGHHSNHSSPVHQFSEYTVSRQVESNEKDDDLHSSQKGQRT